MGRSLEGTGVSREEYEAALAAAKVPQRSKRQDYSDSKATDTVSRDGTVHPVDATARIPKRTGEKLFEDPFAAESPNAKENTELSGRINKMTEEARKDPERAIHYFGKPLAEKPYEVRDAFGKKFTTIGNKVYTDEAGQQYIPVASDVPEGERPGSEVPRKQAQKVERAVIPTATSKSSKVETYDDSLPATQGQKSTFDQRMELMDKRISEMEERFARIEKQLEMLLKILEKFPGAKG